MITKDEFVDELFYIVIFMLSRYTKSVIDNFWIDMEDVSTQLIIVSQSLPI